MILLLLVQILRSVIARPPQFLETPENISTFIGEVEEVTFTCRIHGDFLFWRINDTLYNYLSHRDFTDRGILVETVSAPANEQSERLIIRVSRQNNETKVVCLGSIAGETTFTSQPVFLLIADVPLPPGINWTILDANTLEVTWGEPFTLTQYPITSYSIVIETTDPASSDNDTVLVNTTLSPSTFHYKITIEEVLSCTMLIITLKASSDVGTSEPAAALAVFPDKCRQIISPKIYSSCPSHTSDLQEEILLTLSSEYGVSPLGLSRQHPAQSCNQIHDANPSSTSGFYWIEADIMIEQQYCLF